MIQLREDTQVSAEARKILSFTDNRQDASLQAGHFNDFIQVALVRGALFKALSHAGKLDHAAITKAVFQSLALSQRAYAREPAEWGPGKGRNEEAMQRLLEYRLYEDLRRGWRIVQPNLEQCGLLLIEYPGLGEMCSAEESWKAHPVLHKASPEVREKSARAFLDHLRHEIAIDARVLNPEEHWELRKRVEQVLRDPWAFDEFDQLLASSLFLLPGSGPTMEGRERSLSGHSRIARFMRNRHTWDLSSDLGVQDGEKLILALIEALRGQYVTQIPASDGRRQGIQLMAASFEWRGGDGSPPAPDPVRAKRMRSQRLEKTEREANQFFARLYRETARQLAGVEGAAHTGQIPLLERQEREKRFGEGALAALFCSPTMELGVDIRDLNVVHLRNMPPTPANYAQRSGRAGRGGQPALVMAFCSEGSPHDQYFFERPDDMVAGTVAPARLDLENQELLEAHIHSAWVAATGLKLGRGMIEVLDLQGQGYPLNADIQSRMSMASAKLVALTEECRRILDAGGTDVRQATWNTPEWLDQTLKGSAEAFNYGFDRWRELYAAAGRQRDLSRRVVDNPAAGRKERADAERSEEEAKRQLDLLLNRSDESAESDFYPYRYLASEGFLPGYNFPRLPIRALVPAAERQHVIQRARFLALTEFGPRNVVYHEGRKYRMARCVLPPEGVEARLVRAKLCNACGYFHDGEHALVDRCDHCGAQLDGEHSQYVASLFEMSAVRGTRVERITCDEEERVREGFHITTHYRFAPGPDGMPFGRKQAVETVTEVKYSASFMPRALCFGG
ncbi:MAG TPA: helicase-related protein [Terriglobia bacterium]|nr:helicase-related protein [Terriglobia bacterium]